MPGPVPAANLVATNPILPAQPPQGPPPAVQAQVEEAMDEDGPPVPMGVMLVPPVHEEEQNHGYNPRDPLFRTAYRKVAVYADRSFVRYLGVHGPNHPM